MAKAQATDITRHRNDTEPEPFQSKNAAGTANDITGFSFFLTVNTQPDGKDGQEQFKLTGAIDDAATGKFSFTPTALQADMAPGTYFYDIERTNAAGKIKTIAKGKWIIEPDITDP